MSHSRLVVVGASAGGFEAVGALLLGLPADLPAAVLVVIHAGPGGILPRSLAPRSALPVGLARDGAPFETGRVYLAPPDRHMTVSDGVLRVVMAPREHGFRPAIDPLFVSAARAAGHRVAGVILSGALSDGTMGLRAVKASGGRAFVQHPEEAAFPSMPLSALRNVDVDAVLPVAQIGVEIAEWAVNGTRRGARAVGATKGRIESSEPELMAFTCPSCGGAVSEVREQGLTHYECHVGHRFDSESLVALADERTEDTLWKAVRALQEKALLRRRMLARIADRDVGGLAGAWRAEADDAEARAEEIRRLIEGTRRAPNPGPTGRTASGTRRRRPAGARRASGKISATTQQARASRQLHLDAKERMTLPPAGRPKRRARRRRT